MNEPQNNNKISGRQFTYKFEANHAPQYRKSFLCRLLITKFYLLKYSFKDKRNSVYHDMPSKVNNDSPENIKKKTVHIFL